MSPDDSVDMVDKTICINIIYFVDSFLIQIFQYSLNINSLELIYHIHRYETSFRKFADCIFICQIHLQKYKIFIQQS